ncbi:MAG: translational GTPase TypA [Lentisphaerae bacterium]|nr:MAG: translational GTPase TypA [Lentisphaerota bacterium]
MSSTSINRNIAIIAHVDHGKTTLVDQMFRQSGMFRANQNVAERLMDSMDLERERGITITSKNGGFYYRDHRINIVDTPGHADFGGQVERVLSMVDACLLLVDAAEGPMPQTTFVTRKALAQKLPIILVINKMDKPDARPEWVLDRVLDLFIQLDAPEELLDLPTVYASAVNGWASLDPAQKGDDISPLLDTIIEHVPPPAGDPRKPLQLLISSIDYSPYLGRLGVGKLTQGALKVNQNVAVSRLNGALEPGRISKIYLFEVNHKKETSGAVAGDIIGIAGVDNIMVGETITDPEDPQPLPPITIDPPTVSMNFIANDSPFAGREGQFVTSRQLKERLERETLSDIALHLEELSELNGYKVAGRGELHLAILIEKMRREGYEFQVTRPSVIFRRVDGRLEEPYELLTVDVDQDYAGVVIEKIGLRKGVLIAMETRNGLATLQFRVPTRGLLGYRSEMLTDTRGTATMNYIFDGYDQYAGDITYRRNGAMVAMCSGVAVAYALFNLQNRGDLFISPGDAFYEGQIVGEHSRENDLTVNPAKGKQLTNIRAAGSDENVILTPPRKLTLEDCLSFINEDELIEVTPVAVRLRKAKLSASQRKRGNKKG